MSHYRDHVDDAAFAVRLGETLTRDGLEKPPEGLLFSDFPLQKKLILTNFLPLFALAVSKSMCAHLENASETVDLANSCGELR